jgi:DNA-binding MarR family transcriptional regulator
MQRRLTDDDIQFIKDNFFKMRQTEIAAHLNITQGAICYQIKKLNLGSGYDLRRTLTNEDIQYIKNNAYLMTQQELADKLCVTPTVIKYWTRKLELNTTSQSKIENGGSLYIKNNFNKLPVKKIADNLGVSYRTVYRQIKILGLKS